MVYLDETSSFEELLRKDGSVTIHHRNLQFLATEMFKVDKCLAPIFMNDILSRNKNSFAENVSSNTRLNSSYYNYCNPKKVNYGLETLRSFGPKLWNMIPKDLKDISSLAIFKSKIKGWIPQDCLCRLCKTYVPQLGYL